MASLKSRVCAAAQYAVLDANANVNGKVQILHLHLPKTPQPIWMAIQIYHYVCLESGSGCAKFGGNRSGNRMREKRVFVWIYFC